MASPAQIRSHREKLCSDTRFRKFIPSGSCARVSRIFAVKFPVKTGSTRNSSCCSSRFSSSSRYRLKYLFPILPRVNHQKLPVIRRRCLQLHMGGLMLRQKFYQILRHVKVPVRAVRIQKISPLGAASGRPISRAVPQR